MGVGGGEHAGQLVRTRRVRWHPRRRRRLGRRGCGAGASVILRTRALADGVNGLGGRRLVRIEEVANPLADDRVAVPVVLWPRPHSTGGGSTLRHSRGNQLQCISRRQPQTVALISNQWQSVAVSGRQSPSAVQWARERTVLLGEASPRKAGISWEITGRSKEIRRDRGRSDEIEGERTVPR